MKKVQLAEDDTENGIYEDLLDIVASEVQAIKLSKSRDGDTLKDIFVLARIYAVIKDDYREDLKAGLLKNPA